jgi:hypothetical protein
MYQVTREPGKQLAVAAVTATAAAHVPSMVKPVDFPENSLLYVGNLTESLGFPPFQGVSGIENCEFPEKFPVLREFAGRVAVRLRSLRGAPMRW